MTNPLTLHIYSCVADFLRAFDQKIYPDVKDVPCDVSVLRSELIKEEAMEYAAAPVNSTDELDAIVDLLYVVVGTSVAFSVQILPYASGQIPDVKAPKISITAELLPLTQNLDSRFPCAKMHFKTSEAMVHRLLDIAKIRNYKLREAFDAVHASNMSKLWDRTPTVEDMNHFGIQLTYVQKGKRYLVKDAHGKVRKPPGFQPADLTPFL